MKTLLQINSSGRKARSNTRHLVSLFVSEWQTLSPTDRILTREVGLEPPSAIDERWIAAAFTPTEKRDEEMTAALKESDALVDELIAADTIVLGAPMYNFGMPAQLKAYVDQIVRVGRTFEIEANNAEQPYVPLLNGKRMIIITSTGDGSYQVGGRNGHLNHLDPHLDTIFRFIGIDDLHFVGVGYDEFDDDRRKGSMAAAEKTVRGLARSLAVENDVADAHASAGGAR